MSPRPRREDRRTTGTGSRPRDLRLGECPGHGVSHRRAPLVDGPSHASPRQLGVSQLVAGDPGQQPSHLRVARSPGLLVHEQGPQRLADAPFVDGQHRELLERHRAQGAVERQGSGAHGLAAVAARQREARAGVLHFVHRRALRPRHQVGRCTQGEQVHREARERRHRGVLLSRVLEPRPCESRRGGRVDAGCFARQRQQPVRSPAKPASTELAFDEERTANAGRRVRGCIRVRTRVDGGLRQSIDQAAVRGVGRFAAVAGRGLVPRIVRRARGATARRDGHAAQRHEQPCRDPRRPHRRLPPCPMAVSRRLRHFPARTAAAMAPSPLPSSCRTASPSRARGTRSPP
jgi:hypothetical protein